MDKHLQILQNTRLFSKASASILHDVSLVLETVHIKAGDVVFNKGDAGNSMYIIKQGRLRVHDGDITFNKLGPGDIFGEMAVLDENTRSASITAETDAVLLRLDKAPLNKMMVEQQDVSKAIIKSLCHSLRDRVQDLTDDQVYIKTMERELDIGRNIQAGFLPRKLPDIPGWQVAAFFRAAREVAGDFYDVFEVRKLNRVALVAGDVCDKGVGAALFMTLFRSLLRASTNAEQYIDWEHPAFRDNGDEQASTTLSNSIRLTNNYIAHTHGDTSMFASLFFGLLDPATGSLVYVNCGHESPIIVNSGKIKTQLETTGPVVGIFPGSKFNVHEVQLQPGDLLLAYTDGVNEAMSHQKEQFGDDRLHSLLQGNDANPTELIEIIKNNIQNFTFNTGQSDDITMLAIKWANSGDSG